MKKHIKIIIFIITNLIFNILTLGLWNYDGIIAYVFFILTIVGSLFVDVKLLHLYMHSNITFKEFAKPLFKNMMVYVLLYPAICFVVFVIIGVFDSYMPIYNIIAEVIFRGLLFALYKMFIICKYVKLKEIKNYIIGYLLYGGASGLGVLTFALLNEQWYVLTVVTALVQTLLYHLSLNYMKSYAIDETLDVD